MVAMPCTTVQKMTGAIIMRIKLTKASPRGFMAAPVSGAKVPSKTPITMAISTCT